MSILGAIAGRVSKNYDKNADMGRDMEKQKMLMELQKQYADEIIDPDQTRIQGNMEVYYNARGKELSRRELSSEELEVRKAELDKTKGEGRRAVAEAGLQEFSLENAPESWQLEKDKAAASIFSSRATGSAALSNAATNRMQAEENLGNALYERVSTARSLIYSVGEGDDTSLQSQAEEFDAALESALKDGDKSEVRRITDIVIGSLRLKAMEAEAKAKREPSPWDVINNGRSLDNETPNVTVPLRPGER